MEILLLASIALHMLLVGCTSVDVKPVPAEHRISTVLIKENPKVAVADFLDVLVDGFERHNINAQVVSPTAETGDAYTVTYVAYRKWDMAPYLVDATITIQKDNLRIAHAKRSSRGREAALDRAHHLVGPIGGLADAFDREPLSFAFHAKRFS